MYGLASNRVIDMSDFLHHFRPRWEQAGLVGFCGYRKQGDQSDECMTYSVPKGPFWQNLNITFERIEGPMDRRNIAGIKEIAHPVLVRLRFFVCAPSIRFRLALCVCRRSIALREDIPLRWILTIMRSTWSGLTK